MTAQAGAATVTQPHATPPAAPAWRIARGWIDLSRPRVMAIVNVTPDSFSDGDRLATVADAVAHAERLVAQGADLLDLGGESTRPGSRPVDADTQAARVLPVLRELLRLGVPVSVDTSEPSLMRAALDAGADIVNDVRALRRPGALAALAAHRHAGVCLMHLRGEPATMASLTDYDDVVDEVRRWLAARLAEVVAAGIVAERVVLDPGIGFAKTSAHNWSLLARQRELGALPRPLLVGWSRKGSLGLVTGRGVGDRAVASAAAAVLAVERGARVVRVHDVAATVDALAVWAAALAEDAPSGTAV